MKNFTRIEIQEQLDALAAEAVEVIRQILRDPKTPHAVRLRAAELVLSAAAVKGDDGGPNLKAIHSVHSGPHLVPNAC